MRARDESWDETGVPTDAHGMSGNPGWAAGRSIATAPESVRPWMLAAQGPSAFRIRRRHGVRGSVAIKAAALTPPATFGLIAGNHFPDLDITTLGIGWHRYFLYHSAAAAWVLHRLYRVYTNRAGRRGGLLDRTVGILLGFGALGVGVHLLIDVFQPKAVLFPFLGSLVNGTLVDDRAWLFANSAAAFCSAAQILRQAFGGLVSNLFGAVRAWLAARFLGLAASSIAANPTPADPLTGASRT